MRAFNWMLRQFRLARVHQQERWVRMAVAGMVDINQRDHGLIDRPVRTQGVPETNHLDHLSGRVGNLDLLAIKCLASSKLLCKNISGALYGFATRLIETG